jgi:deoxyribodipyrimidine photo-lyase
LYISHFREAGDVAEIDWCEPGEDTAMETLQGSKEGFLTKKIKGYHSDRNDPTKPKGLSGLSPYLHFGQISAQRCALEARACRNASPQVINISLFLLNSPVQTLDTLKDM